MTRAPRLALVAAVAVALVLPSACGITETPVPGPPSVAPVAPAGAPAPPSVPVAPSPVVVKMPSEPVTLRDPAKKDLAMQLVSSAENSTLDWRGQYGYLEDTGDGRGYTGGLIGFTSGTGDMLTLVRDFTAGVPRNPLAPFLPALRAVDGSDSHDGLGEAFEAAWHQAATDPRFAAKFAAAQNRLRDTMYFEPAVAAATADGLPLLGQFAYYDAAVVHGPGTDPESFGGIRAAAMKRAIRDDFLAKLGPLSGGTLRADLTDVCRGDRHVVAVQHATAHHDGRSLDVTACQLMRVENGRIAEARGHYSYQAALDAFWRE